MAKILITGGAGYIGSVLTPELLSRGDEVTVLDNFMYRQTPLLDVCNNQNLYIVRGDARNKDLVGELIKGKDYIIPLACLVGAPACDLDPTSAKTTNLEAVKIILELREPDQRIVFPNTNSGYGLGKGSVECDETMPLTPISLYGKTKVEAERAVLDSGNSITFRLATVFGVSPRMRLDLLVNDFVYKALTEGSIILFEAHFKRNFIHIRDVARAFIHAMDNFDAMKNEPYNVGLSDANLSKKELCEEIERYIPKFIFFESEFYEDPDKRDYIVSNKKIEKTGFMPQVSLGKGIQELIKGYSIIRNSLFSNV